MSTITLEQAQATLSDLIHQLAPGDEIQITEKDQQVAKLTVTRAEAPPEPRKFGTLRGTVLAMDRFDDPLEDFAEYQ